MPLLHEGQLVRDTYEVERLLGAGAFGEVYRVRHRFLGRQAMKVLRNPEDSPAALDKLLAEALLLSRLIHPNIVRVFDANTTDTTAGIAAFFTMEYVPGGNLDDYWRSFGLRRMPVPLAVDLVRQVCRGLAVAHAAEPTIIHRDVKPANVLVQHSDAGIVARLGDFGLACRVGSLTGRAGVAGTLGFKAPETFRSRAGDSAAGDVWALGCTLYLLLTDEMPFPDAEGSDPAPAQRLVPPSRLNIEVNEALDRIAARCLAARPHQRYPSARELLADLEAWRPDAAVATRGSRVEPEELAQQAVCLARDGGALTEAATLLEEACKQSPALREQYEDQIQIWRRGIIL
jgi:serine/threonine-protein kinase